MKEKLRNLLDRLNVQLSTELMTSNRLCEFLEGLALLAVSTYLWTHGEQNNYIIALGAIGALKLI